MFRLSRWLPCAAALAGVLALGIGSPARSDFQIRLTEFAADGTTSLGSVTINQAGTVVASSGTATLTAASGSSYSGSSIILAAGSTFGDFTLSTKSVFFATNNSPGTPTNANVGFGSSLSLVNNATAPNGTRTLQIEVSAQDFTTPTGTTANLSSDISGTIKSGSGTASGSYTGYASSTNGLFNYSGAQTGGTFGPTTTTFSGTGPTVSANAGSGSYSISYLAKLTLSAGAGLTSTSGDATVEPSTNPNIGVPAPPSVVMGLTALPLLGLGAWLRRRKMMLLSA